MYQVYRTQDDSLVVSGLSYYEALELVEYFSKGSEVIYYISKF